MDAEFFGYLEENVDPILAREKEVLAKVIGRSCRLKADIVEQDERETTGLRSALNYGHTFGHAIEAIAGYGEFLHGEAVSIGMECAARLAYRLGRVNREFLSRQTMLLENLGLPTKMPALDANEMLEAMMRDKKVEKRELKFVLPTCLGHVELVSGVLMHDARAAFDDTASRES